MSARIHGIASLVLIGFAYGLALVVLFQTSVLAGSIYAAILPISLTAIIYSYCGKCLCRMGACAHILPGLISGFLPSRKQGHYTALDFIGTVIPFLTITIIPQYHLWQMKPAFIIFWLCAGTAVTDITMSVCPSCKNHSCLLCSH